MAAIATSANPIEQSFELAAARCDDLTSLVYHRLHAERPETLTMFRTEGSELVKGSMLSMTIEAILDFAGPRHGKFRMIECEIASHDAYGTPRETVCRLLRRDRADIAGRPRRRLDCPNMDEAWRRLQAEIEAMVAGTT